MPPIENIPAVQLEGPAETTWPVPDPNVASPSLLPLAETLVDNPVDDVESYCPSPPAIPTAQTSKGTYFLFVCMYIKVVLKCITKIRTWQCHIMKLYSYCFSLSVTQTHSNLLPRKKR